MRTQALVAVVAGWAAAAGAGAEPHAVRMRVEDGLGADQPLDLYLAPAPDGWQGFGLGPRFNRMPYSVASAPGPDGTQVLTIRVPSDGYRPPPANVRELHLSIGPPPASPRLSEGGEERGVKTMTEELASRPDRWMARLGLENILEARSPHQRRLTLDVAGQGGEVTGCVVRPPGSPTDVSLAIQVVDHRLRLTEDHRFEGALDLELRRQGAMEKPEAVRLVFLGQMIGPAAAGEVFREGGPDGAPPGAFTGTVAAAVESGQDHDLRLTLHRALDTHQFVDIYLAVRGGRVSHAFATSPNYNNATHTVDVSGLTWRDGRLQGKVAVEIQPDPWIPEDGKPVPGSFEIEASLRNGLVGGIYQGRFGDAPPSDGPVVGTVEPSSAATGPAGRYTFKLERALASDSTYHARAFVSAEVDAEGRITGGQISNNHTDLRGSVLGGTMTQDGDRLVADIRFRAERGKVGEGEYTARITMHRVGALAAGTFTCTAPDASELSGTGWAGFQAPSP